MTTEQSEAVQRDFGLTADQVKALAEELAKPEYVGLLAVADDQAAADLLNTEDKIGLKRETRIRDEGIVRLLGPADGTIVLTALETLAKDNVLVRLAWRRLTDDIGLDAGSPITQAQLSALAQAKVFGANSEAIRQALHDYGSGPISRMQSIGIHQPATARLVGAMR